MGGGTSNKTLTNIRNSHLYHMSPDGTPDAVSPVKMSIACYVPVLISKEWIADAHDGDFTRDFLEFTFTILGN